MVNGHFEFRVVSCMMPEVRIAFLFREIGVDPCISEVYFFITVDKNK